MKDIVHYALPLGYFGRILHEVLIKNQLKAIFDYRQKILTEMFGIIDNVGRINLRGNV